jgi:mono/diheme cytochrome c family protein
MMKKLFLSGIILYASSLWADILRGEAVYQANCSQCHSTHMTGGYGRDFNLVSYTRKKAKIIAYVTDPSEMYKEFGYTANAMPTLPLPKNEIEDVADYIDSLQPFKKWMKHQ